MARGSYGVDQHRGVPHDFRQRGDIRRQDWRAARHRLEWRQAEPLVHRWEREGIGEPVEHGQGLIGHEAEKPDVLVQVVPVDGPAERGVLGDVAADDEQLEVAEPFLAKDEERIDQPLEILVRFHVTRVEHEPVAQLVPFPYPHHLFVGRDNPEALVDGVVNDGDFVGRYLKKAEDVALRRFRRPSGCDWTDVSPPRTTPARTHRAKRFGRYCGNIR